MKRLLLTLIVVLFSISLSAQEEAFVDYRWEFGDLALRYPSNWEEPLQRFSTDGTQVMLMLAQNLVDSPETRPPAIPFITVSLLRNVSEDTELYEELDNALEDINIRPVGALPTALFEEAAIATQGYSSDGLLYGMGRIHYLDAERGALLIIGRSASGQRDSFVALFNSLANSITLSASQNTIAPEYGVLWHQARSFADGENAFLDIIGLSLANNGKLYAADAIVGIVVVNSSTGVIEKIIPYEEDIVPSAIASNDNQIFLADSICACVHLYDSETGAELDRFANFGANALDSIALAPDGTLYGTDEVDGEIVVRGRLLDTENIFRFDISPFAAPLLSIDRLGRLVALVDESLVYVLEGETFSLQYELDANLLPNAIAFDSQNQLMLASDSEGILVISNSGEIVNRIGRVVEHDRQAGELSHPSGLAAASDGIIFWAEGDSDFGNITAVSLGVEQGRVGTINLRSGVAVQGSLSDTLTQQYWTFDGLRGDVITLTALADEDNSNLDLTLRLLDPNGREINQVDNDETGVLLNYFDAQVDGFSLPADGQYLVLIGRNSGTGIYQLGLSQSQTIDLSNAQNIVVGQLSDSIPLQRWIFEGRSGQSLTITMEATEGNLDPILYLYNARGDILAENDDGEDLGFDSQIFEFSLPATGNYMIEASRFIGEGSYRLEIEVH